MGRLEYDSSAFAYWTLSALMAFLLPASWFWRRDLAFVLLGQGQDELQKQRARVAGMGGPAWVRAARVRKAEEVFAFRRAAAMGKLGLMGVSLLVLVVFFVTVGGGGEQIQQFDPFEVLGVSSFASETEIKKAYRKLSLQWHPDRWTTADKEQQSVAEARFVKVAKAYAALTDEVAKENYKKYGNPDGRQALEMSIGLPAFLLDPSSQFYVVGCYLMLILIVLPSLVLLWTNDNTKEVEKFGPDSIDVDTQEVFRVSIRKQVVFPEAIDIFAASAEFRALEFRDEEERQVLNKLKDELVRRRLMPTQVCLVADNLGCNHDGNMKACILTYAHIHRATDTLTPGLVQDLEYVLFHAFPLLRLMLAHARTMCFMPTVVVMIRLLQCVTQAMGPETVPFVQVPGMDDVAEAEALAKAVAAGSTQKGENLFLRMLTANPNLSSRPAGEVQAAQDFARRLPVRKLTARIGTTRDVIKVGSGGGGGRGRSRKAPVPGEEDIRRHQYEWEPFSAAGDMMRVLVTAELVNPNLTPVPLVPAVDDGFSQARLASAPFLPFDATEQWIFVLTNGPVPRGMNNLMGGSPKIVAYAVVPEDGEKTVMADLKFLTVNASNDWMGSAEWEPNKTHEVHLYMFSTAYMHLEAMIPLKFKLEEASRVSRFHYHPEDARLGQGPIMTLLGGEVEPEVDSDFEAGEDENGGGGGEDGEEEEEDEEEEVEVPANIEGGGD